MLDSSWLWIVFTVIAAAAQTVRNATQRELTAKLGTVGATHVRFLFGFPFAFVFLAAVMMLKYIGERAASERIYFALVNVFTKRKVFTPDLGGSATTTSFMKAIVDELQSK